MSVYVDDSRIPARVGRLSARWSHLIADTPAELHAFAARLGLRRAWFQNKPNGLWHYDVTESKRVQAIRLGATPVTWRESGRIIRDRRAKAVHLDHPERPGGHHPHRKEAMTWSETSPSGPPACRWPCPGSSTTSTRHRSGS